MRAYKLTMLMIFLLGFVYTSIGQNHRFYLRAKSADFNPTFTITNGSMDYTGNDQRLDGIFSNYDVYTFELAFTHSRRSELQRTWYVEANSQDILNNFLSRTGHLFEFGEYIGTTIPDDNVLLDDCGCDENIIVDSQHKERVIKPFDLRKKIPLKSLSTPFYPNDYGQTGGANLGLNVNYSNYDFMDLPIAWDITTGNVNLILGISDGKVNSNDLDLEKNEEIGNPCSSPFCTNHGTNVAAGAAGQGNNGHGVTGVCYNCDLISTRHNDYDELLALHYAGAKIINCSWAVFKAQPNVSEQMCIDEIYNEGKGSIIVAGAGNRPWNEIGNTCPNPPCLSYAYPAAYNNVISVGSVGHRHETVLDSIIQTSIDWRAHNVKNHVSTKLSFVGNPNVDPNVPYFSRFEATNTLNSAVDILAPGEHIFRYGVFINEGDWEYNQFRATSPATPQVSGVIGLVLSRSNCLSIREIESILKITSTNIDDVEANQVFLDHYGSGSLNAGRAVTLTDALLDSAKIAYLENQSFSRWDFTFNGVSQEIVVRNQEFKEASTINVLAKNSILLDEDTLIEPDNDGYALFDIDPNLVVSNDCGFLPETSDNHLNGLKSKQQIEIQLFRLYPTKVENIINIIPENDEVESLYRVEIYDTFNRQVFSQKDLQTRELHLDLTRLRSGIYVVKGYTTTDNIILTEKIIKL